MGIPPKATKSNNASAGQVSKSRGHFYRGGETNKKPNGIRAGQYYRPPRLAPGSKLRLTNGD